MSQLQEICSVLGLAEVFLYKQSSFLSSVYKKENSLMV